MKKLILFTILLLSISSCGKRLNTTYKVVVTSPDSNNCNIIITSDAHPYNAPQVLMDQDITNFTYEWEETKKPDIRVHVAYLGSIDYPNYKIELYRKGKLVEESSNNDLVWDN